MTLKVGVVGCGDISETYFLNAALFRDFSITCCADLRSEAAKSKAAKHGLAARAVEDLIGADDVDIVLNLTVPDAHAEVSIRALEAGKHVYGEKPLATTLADGQHIAALARDKGLRVGCAPDTVLGAGYQQARALYDAGAIGRPIMGVAAFMSHGMETWHPNPAFFFKKGGGPVLDMGPYYIAALLTLIGPITEVQAIGQIGFAERLVTAEESPLRGQTIKVETFTSVQALLTFANGAQVTMLSSWDVWRHGVAHLELHGEIASMRLPNPNTFAGAVFIADNEEDWRRHETNQRVFGRPNWPPDEHAYANYRGLGLADMARGILDNRPHRANGDMALHALAVMLGILEAATERRAVRISAPLERPAALGEVEAAALLR